MHTRFSRVQRTNFDAVLASDTFFRVNPWVQKSLFIGLHRDCHDRTDGITRAAPAAIFFSLKQYWYFYCCFHYPSPHCRRCFLFLGLAKLGFKNYSSILYAAKRSWSSILFCQRVKAFILQAVPILLASLRPCGWMNQIRL